MHSLQLCLLVLVAGLASAPAQAVTMDLDFTGNALPAGWTQSSVNGGSIRNGRMETAPTDQMITIDHDLAAPMSRIVVSFRGQVFNSYWGSYNELFLLGTAGTASFTNRYNSFADGDVNRAIATVPGGATASLTYAPSLDTLVYEVDFQGNTASYRITDEATQQVLVDMQRTGTMSVYDVQTLRLRAAHTTGAGNTWIDDVHIELTQAPEPGTSLMLGLGLVGLRGRRSAR